MTELWLHPALPMLLAAVLVRVVPRRVGHVLMVLAPAAALAAAWTLGTDASVTTTYLNFDLEILRADALSRPFGVIFAIAAIIAGIYGIATQRAPERTAALAYVGAAMGVVYAGDLLTFFVFWEIKAITSTFVILARRSERSGRAGMRYLFVHIVGGKLLLAGVLVHVAQTGSLTFETFEPGVASTLILLACLISAAVPPLHAWLADAYPEASVAGTVFLSAYTTKAAVYALARGFNGFEILIYLGIVMALYGVVYAVLENDIRRLLGYHIISQVGYMVAAVGIGTEIAINGATAHAFAHILYKGLLLMGVGAVIYATGRSKMSELGGIANRMKPVLALYMIGAVSISSFPLFSGFVSKELVVAAASQGDLTWLVILLKVASVGTFLHTGLKLPYGTWIGTRGLGPTTNAGAEIHVGSVARSMYVAMGIGALLNTAIGVAPGLLYDLLPFPVDYTPYSFGKVVEKTQILLFTGLGFWLLLDRLHAGAKISLDTDVVYRQLPRRITAAFARGRAGDDVGPTAQDASGWAHTDVDRTEVGAPTAAAIRRAADSEVAAPTATDTLKRPLMLRLDDVVRTSPAALTPTWLLGGVLLAASALLLLLASVR